MTNYTVSVAFFDSWNIQTLVTKGSSFATAGSAAIELADSSFVDRYLQRSWDPGRTFVVGIRPGGRLADNDHSLDPVLDGPVPFRLSEAAANGSPCSTDTARELVMSLTALRLWALETLGGQRKQAGLSSDHPIKLAGKALEKASLEGLTV